MIERSNPDVGYFAPEIFGAINMSQAVKANGLLHYSGIVAAGPDGTCVATGDIAEQARWVLEVLRRLLDYEGLTFESLISVTVFTTDIDALSQHMSLFSQAFAGAPPATTWIEIKRLGSPDFLLELVAIAAA